MTSPLRPELAAVVEALARGAEDASAITLDRLGEAIGTRAVSPPEIDAMIALLEARGLRVEGPSGAGGEDALKHVLTSARVLVRELGRRPTPAEIAAHAAMPEEDVRRALALVKVMQR